VERKGKGKGMEKSEWKRKEGILFFVCEAVVSSDEKGKKRKAKRKEKRREEKREGEMDGSMMVVCLNIL